MSKKTLAVDSDMIDLALDDLTKLILQHLYICYACDCQYFLIHDRQIVSLLKSREYEDFEIIDISNEQDRKKLESDLGL